MASIDEAKTDAAVAVDLKLPIDDLLSFLELLLPTKIARLFSLTVSSSKLSLLQLLSAVIYYNKLHAHTRRVGTCLHD
jgi:hypothetical protein